MVPPRNDDHQRPFKNPILVHLKILNRDQTPTVFGDRQDNAVPEKLFHRQFPNPDPLLDQMDGGVHMRACVHHHLHPMCHHTVLAMLDRPPHNDVVIAWQRWCAMAPFVAQFVINKAARGLDMC